VRILPFFVVLLFLFEKDQEEKGNNERRSLFVECVKYTHKAEIEKP